MTVQISPFKNLCVALLLLFSMAACTPQRLPPEREMAAVKSLFENRWTTYQQDERLAELTLREFVYFTECESLYMGLVNNKNDLIVSIDPETARQWKLSGSNRTADNFEVRITVDGQADTVKLGWEMVGFGTTQ